MSSLNSKKLKEEFARLLLKYPTKARDHAFRLFPTDTSTALEAAERWPQDATVTRLMREIAEADPDARILSKTETSRTILDIVQDETRQDKSRIDALRLYAEINGFTAKVVTSATNTNAGIDDLFAKIAQAGRPQPGKLRIVDNK